ncbi:hypothetical protein V8D89_004879 [Ganoderma adspersum]
MFQDPSTFKIAELPSTHSKSMVNVLQNFMDRLGPQDSESESIQVAQLSGDIASLNISDGSQSSVSQAAFGLHRIGSELACLSHPNQMDSRSTQAMNLARALTGKLQRHLRKQAAVYRSEALDDFIVPYEELPGHSLMIRPLALKPDGKQRARERGAREVKGNVLTLEMTQQLINLAYRHVPHNTDLGLRLITHIILLRLAAVLRAHNVNTERISLLTDCPIRAVDIPGEDPSHAFGGVVDYVLAQYACSATPQILPENSEDAAMEAPGFHWQKLGAANIFHVSSVAELTHGLPHGQEAMRAAATNGEYWIFFAYRRSAGSGECFYARSDCFHVRTDEDIPHTDSGWILGILIDWCDAMLTTHWGHWQIENTGNCETFAYFEDPEYEYDSVPSTRR